MLTRIINVILLSCTMCQTVLGNDNAMDKADNKKEYRYKAVENDSTNTRIYTLDNGLTVYLSVYKDAPRIQTLIPVRAGSKNDPSDATGLAHYLEHIMFKGTSEIGSLNWEKEKPMLDKIEALYEKYRGTTDEKKRKKIYQKIDKVSGEAAKYAVANEYDKLISNLGAKGTNAFTSFEQTVYVNDIPSNQLEKWLAIESERFSEITPRLFHTELEAVYEEKNRTLDNDWRKVFTASFENLFPNHQYGQQTTIGTIEHLKNPSITKIKAFFDQNYVPNNMAICLSGDLDPDKTIKLIDKYFGKLKPREKEEFMVISEPPLKQNIEKEVYGPDAENLMLTFRLPHKLHEDIPALTLLNQILYNRQAGLMDINLNQQQKVLESSSFQYLLNDYSAHIIFGNAREGQDLSEVKDLLLEQIELIKKGNFEDWMLEAAINQSRISEMRSMESNRGRAFAMVDAFISKKSWEEKCGELDALKSVTREDIIKVANKYYNNYVCIYKRTGEDPNKVQVEKPEITKVDVNRDSSSAFFNKIQAMKSLSVKPVFLDYNKIDKKEINGYQFLYNKNLENDIFDLYYLIDIGKNHDPELALAIEYLKLLGTDQYSLERINKEFYKLGSKFYVYTSSDQVYIRVSGLQEKFDESVDLFEHLINNVKGDEDALSKMIEGELKKRSDSKLDKSTILYQGLLNYGMYGSENPFNNVLSNDELKKLTADKMVSKIKSILSMKHNVLYYGPETFDAMSKKIEEKHTVPEKLKPLPGNDKFVMPDIKEPVVYWTNYDMVQAEILMVAKSDLFKAEDFPVAALYNEYFGGNMGSIVFQEMRESKALAYSVWSSYRMSKDKDKPSILMSYIGTQVDKLPEAMAGLTELLNKMPESEKVLMTSKNALRNKYEGDRITKAKILFNYLGALKRGIDYDIRKNIYDQVDDMTMETIKKFQQDKVKGQPTNIVVIGSKDKLDFETLAKYGTVKELSLEDLFGF